MLLFFVVIIKGVVLLVRVLSRKFRLVIDFLLRIFFNFGTLFVLVVLLIFKIGDISISGKKNKLFVFNIF